MKVSKSRGQDFFRANPMKCKKILPKLMEILQSSSTYFCTNARYAYSDSYSFYLLIAIIYHNELSSKTRKYKSKYDQARGAYRKKNMINPNVYPMFCSYSLTHILSNQNEIFTILMITIIAVYWSMWMIDLRVFSLQSSV